MAQLLHHRVVSTHVVPQLLSGQNGLLAPRSDIVQERRDELVCPTAVQPNPAEEILGTFSATEGPFKHYQRTVSIKHLPNNQTQITESFHYRLDIAIWGALFAVPLRRALCRGRQLPWWHPPERFSARQARIIALLATVAVLAGFLGTLLGQTITFAREEFGVSKSAQGFALSVIRLSILLTMALAALADRRGRKHILLAAGVGAVMCSAATALAPNLPTMAALQGLARGLAHAMALLLFVFALEESPAGSRAYVTSLLGLAAGLGSGIAVGFVPLADLGTSAWRLIFLMALGGLPLLGYAARHLPESQRFTAAQQVAKTKTPPEHRRRLVLFAATSFAVLLFTSPASQLQNDFLRDERNFSATKITVFVLLTTWTAGPAMLAAGKMADLRGRRVLACLGVCGGALLTLWHFTVAGWPMWVLLAAGTFMTATTVPTLGVYRAEMFGTTRRSKSNGLIGLAGVAGSATGLAVAGVMADAWGYGSAFAALVVGPLLIAVLVLKFYPETTKRSLEELNPEEPL